VVPEMPLPKTDTRKAVTGTGTAKGMAVIENVIKDDDDVYDF